MWSDGRRPARPLNPSMVVCRLSLPFGSPDGQPADPHTSIIIINSLKLKGKYVVSPNLLLPETLSSFTEPRSMWHILCMPHRWRQLSTVACDMAAIKSAGRSTTGAGATAKGPRNSNNSAAIKATLSALTTLLASRHWLCTSFVLLLATPATPTASASAPQFFPTCRLRQQIVGHSSCHSSCLCSGFQNVGRAQELGICWC